MIDWSKRYLFSAVDRLISPMILEISTIYKRNSSICNPNYLYCLSAQEAAQLEIPYDLTINFAYI